MSNEPVIPKIKHHPEQINLEINEENLYFYTKILKHRIANSKLFFQNSKLTAGAEIACEPTST